MPDLATTALRGRLRWQRWRTGGPPTDLLGVLAARREFDGIGRLLGAAPGTTSEPTSIAGRDAELLTPDGWSGDRWLLFLHGGGYCMGSVDASRWSAAAFATALGARAVLVDYRLAPEHPFPAGLDDAFTAYRHLLGSGIPADRILVGGDSAGGGLSVATLLRLRDEGMPPPAGAVAFSPWADLTCSAPSYRRRSRRDLSLSPAFLRLAAAVYLDGHDARDPLASPVFADLTGLPPLLVLGGTEEIVLDDMIALAENGRVAGVDVRSHVGWGMPHCWFHWAGQVPGADHAVDAMAAFADELLTGP